jgi:hypothetical protein
MVKPQSLKKIEPKFLETYDYELMMIELELEHELGGIQQ